MLDHPKGTPSSLHPRTIRTVLRIANFSRAIWLLKLVRKLYTVRGGMVGALQDPDTLDRRLPGFLRPNPRRVVAMTIVEDTRMLLELDDHIQYRAFMDGYFDLVPILLAKRLCDSGATYLDVGANVGTTCLPVANAGIPTIAIEPMPDTLARLYRNIAMNAGAKILVIGAAAGDRDGQDIPMYSGTRGNSGTRSIFQAWASDLEESEPIMVKMLRIDSILRLVGDCRIGLMKIDVEGAECVALAGCPQLFETQQPAVVFEHRTDVAERMRMRLDAITSFFPSHYAFFGVQLERNSSQAPTLAFEPFDPNRSYENVLAISAADAARAGVTATTPQRARVSS